MNERTAPLDLASHADEAKLVILRLLEVKPELSQRQLAEQLGTSLGKTHYLLHALLDAGMVKVRRFRQSNRKLAYAYVLTPSGMSERLHLTRSFLARKEAEFEALKKTIEMLRSEMSASIDTSVKVDDSKACSGAAK